MGDASMGVSRPTFVESSTAIFARVDTPSTESISGWLYLKNAVLCSSFNLSKYGNFPKVCFLWPTVI